MVVSVPHEHENVDEGEEDSTECGCCFVIGDVAEMLRFNEEMLSTFSLEHLHNNLGELNRDAERALKEKDSDAYATWMAAPSPTKTLYLQFVLACMVSAKNNGVVPHDGVAMAEGMFLNAYHLEENLSSKGNMKTFPNVYLFRQGILHGCVCNIESEEEPDDDVSSN